MQNKFTHDVWYANRFTHDVWYAKEVYLWRMVCKSSLLMTYDMQKKFTYEVWYAKEVYS